MIQIAPQMRILVAIEPVDLREGIDGLAQLCRERLGADPFPGTAGVQCARYIEQPLENRFSISPRSSVT